MSGTASVPTQFQSAVTATGLQLDNNFSTVVAYLNDPTNRMNYATDGGSTNTLVINPSPAVSGGYSAGLTITFRAAFSNSGAVVANVNGLGNASVLDQQQRQLTSSAIIAGSVYQMAYNGTSAFNLLSPNAIQASGPTVTSFLSSGTYTFTAAAGAVWARIEIMGGGASGGGVASSGSALAASGGGGSGGYGWLITTSLPGTATLTVGAGASNGAGGDSAFGSLIKAFGGGLAPAATNIVAILGGAGGSCTGAVINSSVGAYGLPPIYNSGIVIAGSGGCTMYGMGGQGVTADGASNPAVGYGAGGSGTRLVAAGSGSANGGVGVGGFISITQYFSA